MPHNYDAVHAVGDCVGKVAPRRGLIFIPLVLLKSYQGDFAVCAFAIEAHAQRISRRQCHITNNTDKSQALAS